jgi:acid phosphatase
MTLSRRCFLAGAAAGLGQMALGCGGEIVSGLWFADENAAKPRLPDAGRPSVRFCAFGDWGHDNEIKRQVIGAMVSAGHAREAGFIALLGDNFYMDGIASARDARWESDFQLPFAKTEFPGPFHPVLGNHDHRGNPRAQVEYTQSSPRWSMPGFYYSATFDIDADSALDVFFLDTTPIDDWDDCAEGQLRWLEDKLANSKARWRIVAGHHAIFSGGTSGASSRLARRLGPLFEQYGVALYLAGHDHDLELLDSRAGWLQVVSGSASRPRKVRWTPRSLFATSEPGYTRIIAQPDRLWIEYVTVPRGPCATYTIDAGSRALESTAAAR